MGAIATNIAPPIILLWALYYEVAEEIGARPYDKFSAIILLGIGVVGYVGMCLVPYNIMTVIVMGAAEAFDTSFILPVGSYMFLNFLVAAVFVPVLILVLRISIGAKLDIVIPQKRNIQDRSEQANERVPGLFDLFDYLFDRAQFFSQRQLV